MDLENINLDTMSKQFEFEKRCREIDEVTDLEEIKSVAKGLLKLYLKQQETFAKI
jgi:tRNA(Ser,Leu) C12 N-acetylase TAN1